MADERFIKILLAKLEQIGQKGIADYIRKNNKQIKDFLRKYKWNIKDMTSHSWVKPYSWDLYGNVTDNILRNTKGVKITNSDVTISHCGQHGYWTVPYIRCTPDEFYIIE